MLTSIFLQNWRSHAKTNIEFSEGSNVFLGQMGSGKSSIVDALCFALYGTYPKLGRRDAKLEDVKNFRHIGKESLVEVAWQIPAGANGAQHSYRLRRSLSPSNAWLYEDEKLLCKGSRQATAQAEKILQIPYELFARAVYAEQNGIDYWFNLSSGERKTELDRLLGLDKFSAARAAAVKEINLLKERAALYKNDATLNRISQMQEEVAAQEQKALLQQKQINEINLSLEAVGTSLKNLQKEHEALKKLQTEFTALKEEENMLSGRAQGLEKNILECASLPKFEQIAKREEEAKASAASIEKTLQKLQAEESAISQSIGRLRAQLGAGEETAKKRAKLATMLKSALGEKTAGSLRAELEAFRQELQKCISEGATLDSRLKEAKAVLNALEACAHGGHPACPVCSGPLDAQKRKELHEKNNALLSSLEAQLKENKGVILQKRGLCEQLCATEAKAARLEASLAALGESENIQKIKTELEGLCKSEEEISKKKAELAQGAKAIANELAVLQTFIQKHLQLKKWQAELDICRARAQDIKKRAQHLNVSPQSLEGASARLQASLLQKAELEGLKRGAAALLENIMHSLRLAKTSLGEATAKRSEMQKLLQEADELEKFKEIVVATQSQLRESLILDINSTLQRLWPILYPYGDWSNVRIIAGEKDYELQIFQGEFRDLHSHASGGERACLGLCLRAALSILLTPQLGWLILDEPTHNLDSQAVQALGRAISEKIPHIIPQVIVITHEPRLLESAPSRVFEFVRDKQNGGDTRVFAAGVQEG